MLNNTNVKKQNIINFGSIIVYCLTRMDKLEDDKILLKDILAFSNMLVAFMRTQGQNYVVDTSEEALDEFVSLYPNLFEIVKLNDDDDDVAYLKISTNDIFRLHSVLRESLPRELKNVICAPQFEGVGLLKGLSR